MKFLRAALLSLLCGGITAVNGEILPVRGYTTSDGLVSNFVQRIVRDSHGFLWFCARGGLSRFDGRTFKTYTTTDGLPNPTVNDILETRAGEYWIATNGGMVRFDPSQPFRDKDGKPNFRVIFVGESAQINRVNRIYEDRLGRIWVTTDGGLFRREEANGQSLFRFVPFEPEAAPSDKYGCTNIAEDGAGSIWAGITNFGVVRILPDERVESYSKAQLGMQEGAEFRPVADRQGRIWIAGLDEIYLIVTDPRPGDTLIERRYTVIEASRYNYIISVYQRPDGRFLITSLSGLGELDGESMHFFDSASFSDKLPLGGTVEDIEGNLWICTASAGVLKLPRNGFTYFAETANNAGVYGIVSLDEDNNGNILAINGSGAMSGLDGSRFVTASPVLPRDIVFTWLINSIFRDSTGQLWVLSINKGLLRFPASPFSSVNQSRPVATYDSKHGLADSVFRIYEDRASNLWISSLGSQRDRLVRWERQTETFHPLTVAEGFPPFNSAFSFAEDRAGNLWIGFYEGGVGRYRNGKFELFTSAGGFPDHMVTDLYLDHAGRLWVSNNTSGLMCVNEPEADRPMVSAHYTAAAGLSSDDVRSIVEDNWGRIYAGTIRGIDRLDVATGNIVHFGLNDGLPNDFVISSFRDRAGNLWFGTFKGVVKFVPEPADKKNPPDIFISGLSAGGIERPVSEIGEHQITGLELSSTENNLQIDFGAISFAFGETLRFRYKLEGASAEWSAPTDQRSVNLSLAPGSYRFIVQAVKDSNGQPLSDKSALVSFRILSPLWRRGWFMASAAALLLACAYGIYRYRIAQILKVERVRTRIASDLHDDIGASLSQIAIVSEVLQHQVSADDERVSKNLNLMARVSREAVDSMSDIVWAINPNKDNLQDLIRRMRRFASETLPNRNIELVFHAPDKLPNLKLGADFRRESFLIFKESINNVLKHSGASRAEIDLRLESNQLVMRVSDNGKGLAAGGQTEGNGLRNMRQRSATLGGQFEIESTNGSGTTVALRLPLHHKPT